MMERYAGGKAQLLEGIDTGLTLSYDLANAWMGHVNATSVERVSDEGGDGTGGLGDVTTGTVVGLSLLALLMVPVVFLIWRRRTR
jgi:hypothetical protein